MNLKKNLNGTTMTIAALVTAVIGYILRTVQQDGGKATALIVFSILFCLAFVGASLTLKRRRKYEDVMTRCMADLLLTSLGVVLMVIGCFLTLVQAAGLEKLLGVLGVLASLALVRGLMLRCQRKPVSALYYVPLTVYYIVRLFVDFRRWSVDPAILDYCFALFASICYMVAGYLAGAFCFDRGGRRTLFVFSMMGVYFTGVSLVYADAQTVLTYLGSAAILLSYVWQTAKPKLKKRGRGAEDAA